MLESLFQLSTTKIVVANKNSFTVFTVLLNNYKEVPLYLAHPPSPITIRSHDTNLTTKEEYHNDPHKIIIIIGLIIVIVLILVLALLILLILLLLLLLLGKWADNRKASHICNPATRQRGLTTDNPRI